MTLVELQRRFWQQVTGNAPLSAESGVFATPPRGTVQDRLRLYRSMYRTRIGEALRSTYPELEARLGDVRFRHVALQYLEHYPSDDPRIEFVGRRLPRFLAEHSDETLRRHANLAHLEWARHAAPLVPDAPGALAVSDVQPEQFARARVKLIPSLHIVETDTDRFRALWCEGTTRFERDIEPDEARALSCAMVGGDLACVCDVFADGDSPIERARAVIGTWFARRWITDISYR